MIRRQFLGSMAAASLAPTLAPAGPSPEPSGPLRLAMVGLVHGHAGGFLGRYRRKPEVDLVGFAEPRKDVADRYAGQFDLDRGRIFESTDALLDRTKPEAVVVFTDTFDHLAAVAACAARQVPVMMEKPLAVSLDHARQIEALAKSAAIPVLVNYETTWYASNRHAYAIARRAQGLGPIRKVVVHDGHRGPVEIGCQPEFVAWLTDPARNGAGALYDFGCYGANLMTWLMDDTRPTSVTAVTRRFKPDVYPRVDDEATIILEYPEAQAIIQASWNWPIDRKDLEIYGQTGQLRTVGLDKIAVRLDRREAEVVRDAPRIRAPEDDFLTYLAAVARKQVEPSGLSTLKNNVIVAEILDLARRSAAEGRTITLT